MRAFTEPRWLAPPALPELPLPGKALSVSLPTAQLCSLSPPEERRSRLAWETPQSTSGEAAEGRKMPLALPLGALVLLLFHTASLEAGEIKEITVEIASGNVFLTCPEEKSEWWDKKSDLGTSRILNISAPDDLLEIERGKEFSCGQKKSKSWRIYLKIKGCKDCVELSLGLGAGIIVADLLLTLGLLLLVYFCSQKQPGLFRPGAPRRQRLQGQQADHPPPVPNPDYEPIRKGQGEVYAGLAPQAF